MFFWITRVFSFEGYVSTFATPDPISLHFFERMRPVNRVEIIKQTLRIVSDAEHPLTHWFANNRKPADLTFAIHDFFIGENGAELFTPPNWCFGYIGEPKFI